MLKKDLKLLLSENNIQQVIDVLLSLTEVVNDNEALFNEVILISARYRFYLPAKSAGTLNFEEEQLLVNKINASLLQVIQKLPDRSNHKDSITPLKKKNSVIELLIDNDFYNFDSLKKEHILATIAEVLNIERQEIIVRKVSMGSVLMLIEVPKGKAKYLANLFKPENINAAIAELRTPLDIVGIRYAIFPFALTIESYLKKPQNYYLRKLWCRITVYIVLILFLSLIYMWFFKHFDTYGIPDIYIGLMGIICGSCMVWVYIMYRRSRFY